jgi:LysM repeat protein
MKITLQSFIFILTISTAIQSTAQIQAYYDKSDERPYYMHTVQVKETLYAISKTYGCDVSDIMTVNKMKSPALSPGQELMIPFRNEALIYDRPHASADQYEVVIYQVRRKETVFRICRAYFAVNLTAIKDLNRLEKNSLSIGQKLKLGYLKKYHPAALQGLEAVKEELIVETIETLPSKEIENLPEKITIRPIDLFDDQIYTVSHENGAAFWNKDAAGLHGYYVLHRYAKRNTWIEVTNPMYNMSVRAKVIGNIPEGSYPDDVLVVVSPSIAKDLGAIDARFYVKVRYLRAETKMTKGK